MPLLTYIDHQWAPRGRSVVDPDRLLRQRTRAVHGAAGVVEKVQNRIAGRHAIADARGDEDAGAMVDRIAGAAAPGAEGD